MTRRYTVKEIATALGITERAALKRAKTKSWSGEKRAVGKGLEYPLSALPEDVQAKIRTIYKDEPIAEAPLPTEEIERAVLTLEEAKVLYKGGHISQALVGYLFSPKVLAEHFPVAAQNWEWNVHSLRRCGLLPKRGQA